MYHRGSAVLCDRSASRFTISTGQAAARDDAFDRCSDKDVAQAHVCVGAHHDKVGFRRAAACRMPRDGSPAITDGMQVRRAIPGTAMICSPRIRADLPRLRYRSSPPAGPRQPHATSVSSAPFACAKSPARRKRGESEIDKSVASENLHDETPRTSSRRLNGLHKLLRP